MLDQVEGWLLNQFAGKLIARGAVIAAGYVASTQAQAILGQFGVHGVAIDPGALAAGGIALANAAFEWYKKRRMANPNSVAVQTDPTAPGADIPAASVAAPKAPPAV